MDKINLVHRTDHIHFDENFKSFSLLAGNSHYVFCISPELTLEHLYWGKKLHRNFDLRYLSQSCRMAHFNTIEAAPTNFEGKIVLQADTLDEIQKSWRMNRSVSIDDEGYFQKRRLENYSWRILSKATLPSKSNTSQKIETRLKSHSVAFDTPPRSEVLAVDAVGQEVESRLRSASNPIMSASFSTTAKTKTSFNPDALKEFLQLNEMTKFVQESPSSAQHFGNLVGQKGSIRHHANKQTFERQLGKIGKGLLCAEYADHGTGDFRSPSFIVVDNFNGSSISPLKYKRHRIYRGKYPMPDSLPGIRCEDPAEASTLIVTMADAGSGLEVDLVYGNIVSDHFFPVDWLI